MHFQKYFSGKQAHTFEEAVQLFSPLKNAQLIKMEQVHGNNIVEVFDLSQNSAVPTLLSGVDACYTTQKNTFLSVKSADCLPILISGIGELHPFVAAAHAGRKSTEMKILYNLLEELNNKYNLVRALEKNLDKLNIWFGPAICERCYQIDRATDTHYDLIAKNEQQVREFFINHQLDPAKYLHLEIENHCTLHEPEKYYSYRATGPGVQMNYSFIGIV